MARFVVLVIDSFGVGAMKDVTLVRPQDAGANTCGHILSQLPHLQLPTLEKLGLINALGYAPGDMQPSDSATWGVAELQHEGGGASGNFRHAPVTAAADAFSRCD